MTERQALIAEMTAMLDHADAQTRIAIHTHIWCANNGQGIAGTRASVAQMRRRVYGVEAA